MENIIIAGSGYAAYSILLSQVRKNIKRLDKKIQEFKYQPLTWEQQFVVNRRMRMYRLKISIQENINKIVDQMPMPEELC
jgi:hypothetical protein